MSFRSSTDDEQSVGQASSLTSIGFMRIEKINTNDYAVRAAGYYSTSKERSTFRIGQNRVVIRPRSVGRRKA